MKTLKLFFLIIIALVSISLNAQIKVKSDGKIGLGTTSPSTLLHFKLNSAPGNEILYDFPGTYPDIKIHSYMADNFAIEPSISNKGYIGLSQRFYMIKSKYVYCYDLVEGQSDIRFKENIRSIDSSLIKLISIRGIKYDLKPDYYKDIEDETLKAEMVKESSNKYGLIAQEIVDIFPEVVSYDSIRDEYGISYTDFIPILIEAIKEQQSQIETLQTEIESIKSVESKTKSTADNDFNITSALFQNQPNPFNENTYINYIISDEVNKATIYIYDLQGKQVKAINVNERGQGSSVIYGSELYAGTYHYTLITDGQIVGTYTMILTN